MAQPLFQTEKTVSPEVEKEVRDMFEYHPWTEEQQAKGKEVRESLVQSVFTLIRNVPPGPDRTVAIRKIREARMDANSSITHKGRY